MVQIFTEHENSLYRTLKTLFYPYFTTRDQRGLLSVQIPKTPKRWRQGISDYLVCLIPIVLSLTKVDCDNFEHTNKIKMHCLSLTLWRLRKWGSSTSSAFYKIIDTTQSPFSQRFVFNTQIGVLERSPNPCFPTHDVAPTFVSLTVVGGISRGPKSPPPKIRGS